MSATSLIGWFAMGHDSDLTQRAWFAHICSLAKARVQANRVPAYLREALLDEVLVRLTKESDLPPRTASELLTVVVALDIALSAPKRSGTKQVKREVARFFQHVKMLATAAQSLSPYAWVVITGPTVRVDDGSIETETWEQSHQHVLENAKLDLRELLKLQGTNTVPRGSAGRHLPPAALAEIYLYNLLAQHGCKLTLEARSDLSYALFEDVKSHHRMKNRAKTAKESHDPRNRDLVSRASKRRTVRK